MPTFRFSAQNQKNNWRYAYKRLVTCASGALLVLPVAASALTALDDESLADVNGAGIAVALDDFRFAAAPTSFIEMTGTAPGAAAAAAGWQRGDARYYGLSISGAGAGEDWFGNGCDDSSNPLACPLGQSGVANFATVYNPYVLRVFGYDGFDYQGNFLSDAGGDQPTILELIGPTVTDTWRWSFWGELEIDRGGSSPSHLQSQTIIYGKPVASGDQWNGLDAAGVDLGYTSGTAKPAILRLMQTANSADPTLGITYQSALSGDFRFSVRQTSASPDVLHSVPDFQDQEGVYFKNVDAFLPLGTLNYQAITLDDTPANDGNFIIELTAIPNDANIYSHFYCGSLAGSCALDANDAIDLPNPETHGYVRWGDFSGIDIAAGTGLPTATDTTNGIYFVGGESGGVPQNTVTNLGVSRIEGMLIQHMKITTLGAGI